MGIFEIVSIILGVVLVLVLIMFIFINRKYTKLLKALDGREVDDVNIKKGVRYTTDELPEKNNETNVTYNEKDIILEVNKEYVIGENKKMLPGTYVVLASNETYDKFNIRVSGLVKEYKHNEKIVLADGDEVTAVSTTVILR